ncbi:cobalamin biosynthesis protein [Candidatus Bathyarchaeota archaeon]|nr:cobalamin biosynthesis protein [Candidatus Bathyarchaeota archaeon]MBS7613527.1 cobalamin biosynthesis protein [Candidatus Bathyarchaeota archaeon]MBS7617337.1 cobalamin biosynthesis protein [Candidatus Bathyarchaeota archaeon]
MDSSRWVFPKKTVVLILMLIVVSPIFGVLLADMFGYHEPLDVAAEALNLPDLTELMNWTPFLDYTIPELPAGVGYIIAGFIGVFIILSLGVLLSRMVRRT